MQQLTQKLKNGKLSVKEVPFPILQKRHILVRNHYSVISVGTETSTIKTARKNYIGKAKEKPHQLKQVIETLKSQGPVSTYRAVMKKLDVHSPLGYSCAGEVIDIAPDVRGYQIGDYVACGGLGACHAEIVSVSSNLCVKLESNTDIKQAAYNSLGAIALQGIRQADLQLGETCAIIGLGLIGQLTAIMLRVSGIKVLGIDIDPARVALAKRYSCDLALVRDEIGIEEKILHFTENIGCDGVIITAETQSLDPINFAGFISRKRGKVIIVGNSPTGFDREPHYYQKELLVKMSCSYGPGRYDPSYEAKGLDYPSAYVRWTENRNMQAFQDLIHAKKIDLGFLTTQVFQLEQAPHAYELLISKSEPFMGVLIEYDTAKEMERKLITIRPPSLKPSPQSIMIGFFGAGSHAQIHLLPNIKNNSRVSLKGIMTASGASSRSAAERYGFEFCTDKEDDIFNNEEINIIFIATRHDSHARLVQKALKSGKHVFVEKPLCLTEDELVQIIQLIDDQKKPKASDDIQIYPCLMVGYNRRFSPFGKLIKNEIVDGPVAMTYRINAGPVPADSWIQDKEFGGGRIIGEICHFVDFLTFINGSMPISVYAKTMVEPKRLNDTVNISLAYENGSVGAISYFSNGDTMVPKERCEIFSNGCAAVLDDFKKLEIYAHGKKRVKRLISQDKGQNSELKHFLEALRAGQNEIIPLKEIINTSVVTFKIIESIRTGNCIQI